MTSNYDAVLARLEKAVTQIEAYASKVGSGVSHALHNATHGSTDQPAAVAEWNALLVTYLTPFIAAANKFPETKKYGDWADKGFHRVGDVIAASFVSKKPSDAEFIAFLDPVVQVITSSQATPDPTSPYVNHAKAFSEGIASLNWVTVAPPNGLPKDVAQSGYEAADFYLIKILTEGKKKGGKEGEDFSAFASTFKALLQKQAEFVKEHAKTGLEWKFNGQPLSAYSASAGGVPPPPGGAPPAPSFTAQASAAASNAATAVAGGMGAVFGQLGQLGDSVTGGLKKVTNDMKTKNLKDKPALEPTKAPAPGVKAAAAPAVGGAKVKKEPKTSNQKGTWFVENYDGGSQTVEGVELKESVYVLGCSNTTIRVPVKCKSIQVDSCKRLTIEFKQVVSTFEVVNSDRVTVYVTDNVPSISIDKTDGASIHLSRAAVASPPQIYTSKVSELNLVVPGKTDEDDPIEMPLPEQYLTVYEGGKLKTESVAHSAN